MSSLHLRLIRALSVLSLLVGLSLATPLAASAAPRPSLSFCTAVHNIADLKSATAIKALVGKTSLYAGTIANLETAQRSAPTTEVRLALEAMRNDLITARANQLKASADHNPFSSALYVGKITYYALKATASSVVVFSAYRACN